VVGVAGSAVADVVRLQKYPASYIARRQNCLIICGGNCAETNICETLGRIANYQCIHAITMFPAEKVTRGVHGRFIGEWQKCAVDEPDTMEED
jgi:thiamine pyrophosphate-dependent acetolactate synthase large subunit-like protein